MTGGGGGGGGWHWIHINRGAGNVSLSLSFPGTLLHAYPVASSFFRSVCLCVPLCDSQPHFYFTLPLTDIYQSSLHFLILLLLLLLHCPSVTEAVEVAVTHIAQSTSKAVYWSSYTCISKSCVERVVFLAT